MGGAALERGAGERRRRGRDAGRLRLGHARHLGLLEGDLRPHPAAGGVKSM